MDSSSDQAAPDASGSSESKTEIGTSLVPYSEKPEPPRSEAKAGNKVSRFQGFFALGTCVALTASLLGFASVPAWHFVKGHLFAAQAAVTPEAAETAELRRIVKGLAEEIHAVKTSLEGLQGSIATTQTLDEMRALKKGLDGLKAGAEMTKSETNAAIAQLSAKIDHLPRESSAKLQQLMDRLDRVEKQSAAPMTTASIPSGAIRSPVPSPPAKIPAQTTVLGQNPLAAPGDNVDQPKKPQLITGWVVREVYDGIALLEGKNGRIEVVPGETIPGAGTVKSIERRGRGWIVLTSRGLVDYGGY
jgi:hypothetical protein